jgi:hypothetical protein
MTHAATNAGASFLRIAELMPCGKATARAVAELRADVVRLLARAQRVGAVRRRSDPATLDALRAAANALWTPRPAGSVELRWSALRTGT